VRTGPTLTTQVPGHIWPAVWTALTWCGAVAFPVTLYRASQSGTPPGGLFLFLPAVLALVLVVRLLFRRPLAAVALMLAGSLAVAGPGRAWETHWLQALPIDLAVGYIVATRRRSTALLATVMVLGTQIGLAIASGESEAVPSPSSERVFTTDSITRTVPFVVMAMVTAWTVGYLIRGQRERAEALRSQATAQAVTDERLRIARELHDVISHSIGSIAIQAGVGSRVIDTQPAEARNALAAIEATSREALAGLRRTLAALRRSEPEPAPGATLVTPTPGLDGIDRLVDSVRDAGVRVEVRWRGQRRPLPPDVDLAAFRIIQEAVTNVVRHAGTASCRVTVDYGDSDVSIEVDDDGRGGLVVRGGYGIVGIRERVGLLHGEFSAGPRPEGGFRVTARLPLPTEAR
jgi:signal transduction histidine kinase